jgi:hypothetical protein
VEEEEWKGEEAWGEEERRWNGKVGRWPELVFIKTM